MLKKPMEKEIKDRYSEFNKQEDIIKFRIDGGRILAESATSVLVNVMDDERYMDFHNPSRTWISKKLVFKPEYGTYLNLYIRENYSFNIFTNETESKKEKQEVISTQELYNRIGLEYGCSKV